MTEIHSQVQAAVLAGGKSSRFGSDKSLAQLPGDDLTLLGRVIATCREVAGRVVIIAPFRAEYAARADAVIPDATPEAGPLGGMLTALRECQSSHLLLAACDQPFLTSTMLLRLIGHHQDADVVVFAGEDGHFETFPSLLRRATVLPFVEERFDAGERSIMSLLRRPGSLRIAQVAIGANERAALRDIDTPADLRHLGA